MSELEDKISEVLADPQQMAQITRLAQSLMGGETGGSAPDTAQASALPNLDALGVDGAMLARLARAINANSDQDRAERALLEAMRAYLSEKRRGKLERAMKIARLASIAKMTIKEAEDSNA